MRTFGVAGLPSENILAGVAEGRATKLEGLRMRKL